MLKERANATSKTSAAGRLKYDIRLPESGSGRDSSAGNQWLRLSGAKGVCKRPPRKAGLIIEKGQFGHGLEARQAPLVDSILRLTSLILYSPAFASRCR